MAVMQLDEGTVHLEFSRLSQRCQAGHEGKHGGLIVRRGCADMLQITTWLSPLSAAGATQNVPAFMSVEAILLQKAKAASFQVRSQIFAAAADAGALISSDACCSMPARHA